MNDIKLCDNEQDGLCIATDQECPHGCRKPGWECGLEDLALSDIRKYEDPLPPEIRAKYDRLCKIQGTLLKLVSNIERIKLSLISKYEKR